MLCNINIFDVQLESSWIGIPLLKVHIIKSYYIKILFHHVMQDLYLWCSLESSLMITWNSSSKILHHKTILNNDPISPCCAIFISLMFNWSHLWWLVGISLLKVYIIRPFKIMTLFHHVMQYHYLLCSIGVIFHDCWESTF